MIASYVIDPAAFDPEYFDGEDKVHAKALLLKILKNGLLVLDDQGALLKELTDQLAQLTVDKRQHITLLLEELIKTRDTSVKRMHLCPRNVFQAANGQCCSEIADEVKRRHRVQCQIKNQMQIMLLNEENPQYDRSITCMRDYDESGIEQKRKRWEDSILFGEDQVADIEEALARLFRYSKSVDFYDPYMAACTGGAWQAEKWYRGLAYLLDKFASASQFAQERVSVRLYSRLRMEEPIPDAQKEAARLFERKIVRRLSQKFPRWHFRGYVKNDEHPRIFRHRMIQTEHAVIDVNEGFELFEGNTDRFRSNYMRMDNNLSRITSKIRVLSDFSSIERAPRDTISR